MIKKPKLFGHSLKKGDFLIFALIVTVVVSVAIGFYRTPLSANTVKIYVDSKEYATYVFSDEYEKIVTITTEEGYNQIKLQSGSVQMIDSDCPGHDCMRMGKISHAGDVLTCLPHKVMIVLEGGDSFDAVSY